jgi:hypothetical protein
MRSWPPAPPLAPLVGADNASALAEPENTRTRRAYETPRVVKTEALFPPAGVSREQGERVADAVERARAIANDLERRAQHLRARIADTAIAAATGKGGDVEAFIAWVDDRERERDREKEAVRGSRL